MEERASLIEKYAKRRVRKEIFAFLSRKERLNPPEAAMAVHDIRQLYGDKLHHVTTWYYSPKEEQSGERKLLVIYAGGNDFHPNIYEKEGRFRPFLETRTPFILVPYSGSVLNPLRLPSEQALIKDVEKIFYYALTRLGYQESEIILYGYSLGAYLVAAMAAKYPGIMLANLENPPLSVKRVVAESIPEKFYVPQKIHLEAPNWNDAFDMMRLHQSLPLAKLHLDIGGEDGFYKGGHTGILIALLLQKEIKRFIAEQEQPLAELSLTLDTTSYRKTLSRLYQFIPSLDEVGRCLKEVNDVLYLNRLYQRLEGLRKEKEVDIKAFCAKEKQQLVQNDFLGTAKQDVAAYLSTIETTGNRELIERFQKHYLLPRLLSETQYRCLEKYTSWLEEFNNTLLLGMPAQHHIKHTLDSLLTAFKPPIPYVHGKKVRDLLRAEGKKLESLCLQYAGKKDLGDTLKEIHTALYNPKPVPTAISQIQDNIGHFMKETYLHYVTLHKGIGHEGVATQEAFPSLFSQMVQQHMAVQFLTLIKSLAGFFANEQEWEITRDLSTLSLKSKHSAAEPVFLLRAGIHYQRTAGTFLVTANKEHYMKAANLCRVIEAVKTYIDQECWPLFEEEGGLAFYLQQNDAAFTHTKDILEPIIIKNQKGEIRVPSQHLPQLMTAIAYKAVKAYDADTLLLCLEQGVHVDSKYQGRPLLHHAIEEKQLDAAALLLLKGANVNAKDDKGETALLLAASKTFIDGYNLLRQHGAVTKLNAQGEEAVFLFTRKNSEKGILAMHQERLSRSSEIFSERK